MQNIKLLNNGFFGHPDKEFGTEQLSALDIRENFEKVLFYFELDNCSDNKLKFDCGYFSPKEELTYFYLKEEKTVMYSEYKIINIEPSFFAFILPYPLLYFNIPNSQFKEKSYPLELKTNPFVNQLISKKARKIRFSNTVLENDLSKKYNLHILHEEYHSIHNFTKNNCYPLFVEDINDIRILVDDYNIFLNEVLGFSIGIDSLSKIIVPYFDIDKFNKINGEFVSSWKF